ncbi:MAG: hypothetical protein MHM6MM_006959 [Cercozoa sp. M6MM]
MSSDSEFFDELEGEIERLHALIRRKKAERRRKKATKRQRQSVPHLGDTKAVELEQDQINSAESSELSPKRRKLTTSSHSANQNTDGALPALEENASNTALDSAQSSSELLQQEQEQDQRRRSVRTRQHRQKDDEAPEPNVDEPQPVKKSRKKRVSDTLLDTPKAVLHPAVVVTMALCDEKRKLSTECRTLFLLTAKILAQHGSIIDRGKACSAEDTTGTTYAELLTALMKENDLPEKYRNSVNKALKSNRLQISSCSPIKAMVSAMSRRTETKMLQFHIDGQLHSLQKSRNTKKRAMFRLVREQPKPVAESSKLAETQQIQQLQGTVAPTETTRQQIKQPMPTEDLSQGQQRVKEEYLSDSEHLSELSQFDAIGDAASDTDVDADLDSNETHGKAAEILRHVEFYLGDSNLPVDRYLQDLLKQSEQGWLDIAHFLSCNKIRALSEDVDEIAKALRRSFGLLEVSQDGSKVRRRHAIADMAEARKALLARMLFAEPVPPTATMEEIKAFFESTCNKTVFSVRTCDVADKRKSAVFVEFECPEVVEEVKRMRLLWPDEGTKRFLTKEGFMHLMSRPEYSAWEDKKKRKKKRKKDAEKKRRKKGAEKKRRKKGAEKKRREKRK